MRKLPTATLLILLSLLLSACQGVANPAPEATAQPTPGQQPTVPSDQPRALTICIAEDPGSLYRWRPGPGSTWNIVFPAIYDGPFELIDYQFETTILEKYPSLKDGDVRLDPVPVQPGERIVDANKYVVTLQEGVLVRPSGCKSSECAIAYDGFSELLMDQQSNIYQLRPGLRWSDGHPFTTADVVYGYQLADHPDTGLPQFANDRTQSFTALDELRVEWVGLPGFQDNFYWSYIWFPMPEHLFSSYTPAELATAEVSTWMPIGWGPYALEDRVPGESLTLRRNDYYYRADEGLPRFDRLVYRIIGNDASAAVASMLSGECDLIDSDSLQVSLQEGQAERLLALDAQGRITTEISSGYSWEHIEIGIHPYSYDDGWQPGDRPDFFGDVRTRQAIAHCLDRQRLAEIMNLGNPSVAHSYVQPDHPLYNPDVRHYPHEPAAGAALLEDVGWQMGSNGVRIYQGDNPQIPPETPFSITLDAFARVNRDGTRLIVSSLADCGIELEVEFWEPLELIGPDAKVRGRRFDLALMDWPSNYNNTPICEDYLTIFIPGEDQSVHALGWEGFNVPGFSHPDYDRACLAAYSTHPGQPQFHENHLKAQVIFAEQLPAVPLYFRSLINAARPDFCGTLNLLKIEEFDYGPDC